MKFKTFQVNSTEEIEKIYNQWCEALKEKSNDTLPESAYSRSMFLKTVIKFWKDENDLTNELKFGYFKRN